MWLKVSKATLPWTKARKTVTAKNPKGWYRCVHRKSLVQIFMESWRMKQPTKQKKVSVDCDVRAVVDRYVAEQREQSDWE